MSFASLNFRISAGINDYKRDKAIPLPEGITCCRNISYGTHGNANLLDVYYPDGTNCPLPTIVSIHGGGYVYGSKEIYRRYGMDMAKRGFAFVNFNYRLAPRWRFPTPLEDTNAVMEWICKNAARYHLDPHRIILVGDSAGAQLTSQYAAIATNQDYARLFSFLVPDITIRAVGLNCGMYDMVKRAAAPRSGILLDYLGNDTPANDPRFRVLESITEDFPPAYIVTACHDFLREEARPMWEFLTAKGIDAQWKCYGNPDRKEIGHVFHVNIALPEAKTCNDQSCDFFRQYV